MSLAESNTQDFTPILKPKPENEDLYGLEVDEELIGMNLQDLEDYLRWDYFSSQCDLPVEIEIEDSLVGIEFVCNSPCGKVRDEIVVAKKIEFLRDYRPRRQQ